MSTITINCDASYHPIYNTGGFAFWISTQVGPHKKYGEFKQNPGNSFRAELWCLLNALKVARSKFKFVAYIYVNIDNKSVIRAVKDGKFPKQGYEAERERLLALIEGVTIDIRHVKGHSSSNSPRTYVNNWCDEHAKKYIENYRKQDVLTSKV